MMKTETKKDKFQNTCRISLGQPLLCYMFFSWDSLLYVCTDALSILHMAANNGVSYRMENSKSQGFLAKAAELNFRFIRFTVKYGSSEIKAWGITGKINIMFISFNVCTSIQPVSCSFFLFFLFLIFTWNAKNICHIVCRKLFYSQKRQIAMGVCTFENHYTLTYFLVVLY